MRVNSGGDRLNAAGEFILDGIVKTQRAADERNEDR